jgi:hypothetical protein
MVSHAIFYWHSTTQTLTTRTQTLSLWPPPKDWAPVDMEILEVTTSLVVDGNVAYHLTYNVGKSQSKSRKRCEHQDLNPGG